MATDCGEACFLRSLQLRPHRMSICVGFPDKPFWGAAFSHRYPKTLTLPFIKQATYPDPCLSAFLELIHSLPQPLRFYNLQCLDDVRDTAAVRDYDFCRG